MKKYFDYNGQKLVATFLMGSSLALTACSGTGGASSSSYDTTTASTLASAVAGTSSSADDSSGANVALYTPLKARQGLFDLFIHSAQATTCISGAKVEGQTCTSSAMTVSLSNCTAGGASWTGSEVLTYGTSGACSLANSGGLLNAGANATITITEPSGITRTNALGAYVTTDSSSSGYSSALSGGLEITCGGTSCSAGRSVTVNGLHRAAYTAAAVKVYDHTLSTSSPLVYAGVGSSREISSGTIVLQHNLAQYTATAVIATPLTFSAGCCIPTGGSLTTTFSGSKTGTETVEFSSTCGVGTVNGTAFTATHCI